MQSGILDKMGRGKFDKMYDQIVEDIKRSSVTSNNSLYTYHCRRAAVGNSIKIHSLVVPFLRPRAERNTTYANKKSIEL